LDGGTEVIRKATLCLLAVTVLGPSEWLVNRLAPRKAQRLLGLTAVLSVAAYFNFGLFHDRRVAHHWELFHYFLGSRYFPELGYDGIYVASLTAQREGLPGYPVQARVRDLRTNQVSAVGNLGPHAAEVRARFAPERWRSFVADNRYFLTANNARYIELIRQDHGYNPTPTWTFVAQLLGSRWLAASPGRLTALALLDPLLLAAAFVVVFRVFGARVACTAMILFGLGYPWRYYWVGGAFLRQDWFVASILAACALRRGRHGTAGALVGYGTTVRVFPVLFLFGPTILAIRAIVRRESLSPWRRLAAGFTVSVLLGLAAGAMAGRGPAAWPEFVHNLEKHRTTWLTNNIGLRNLALYGTETLRNELVDWSLPEPWGPWKQEMQRRYEERRVLIWLLAALLLLPTAAAAWRAAPHEALILGIVPVFALLSITCYYWVMLVALALWRTRGPAMGVLALNAALFGLHYRRADELASGLSLAVVGGATSLGLLVLFLAWVLPAWAATFARRPVVALDEQDDIR
jgi:hypothetical protein